MTKLRASDGSMEGTFPVGQLPLYLAFDGAAIWVSNYNDNTVTKLQSSDGALLGTFPSARRPEESPLTVRTSGSPTPVTTP